MAAELRTITDLILEKKSINEMIDQLKYKSKQCVEEVTELYRNDNDIKKQLEEQCNRDYEQFVNYLQQYKKQFIENGTEICYKRLYKLQNSDNYTQSKQICLENQISGSIIFEQNILQKLKTYI